MSPAQQDLEGKADRNGGAEKRGRIPYSYDYQQRAYMDSTGKTPVRDMFFQPIRH